MRNSVILALFLLLFLPGKQSLADDAPVKDESKKPLVVMLFDQNCHVWCGQVRPMLKELSQEYEGRVKFAELDTTQSILKETMKQAKQLHIDGFIPDAMGNVPEVIVFTHGHEMVGELSGAKKKEVYKASIEKALKK